MQPCLSKLPDTFYLNYNMYTVPSEGSSALYGHCMQPVFIVCRLGLSKVTDTTIVSLIND